MFIPFSFCLIHLIAWMPADEEHASSSDRNGRTISRSDCHPRADRDSVPAPPPRDFTENFDLSSSYWTTFGTNNVVPDAQLQNGFLVFNLNKTNTWTETIYNAQTYQDVRVDAQVDVRGKRWRSWNCLPLQPNQWLV